MPYVNIPPIKNGDSATPALFNERFGKIADVINGGLDSSNLVNGAVTTEKIAAGAVTAEKFASEPDWLTPTLQNSWVEYNAAESYGNAQYYKDAFGVVHLRGLIKNGTMNVAMFTLPVGYRPNKQLIFPVVSNNAIARVDVKTNGEAVAISGNNVWVSLVGISFRAES